MKLLLIYIFLPCFFFSSTSYANFLTKQINDIKEGLNQVQSDVQDVKNKIQNKDFSQKPRLYVELVGLKDGISPYIIDKVDLIIRQSKKFETISKKEMQSKVKIKIKDTQAYKHKGYYNNLLEVYRTALSSHDYGVLLIRVMSINYSSTGKVYDEKLNVKASIKLDVKFATGVFKKTKKIQFYKTIKYNKKTKQLEKLFNDISSKMTLRERIVGELVIEAIKEIIPKIPDKV